MNTNHDEPLVRIVIGIDHHIWDVKEPKSGFTGSYYQDRDGDTEYCVNDSYRRVNRRKIKLPDHSSIRDIQSTS